MRSVDIDCIGWLPACRIVLWVIDGVQDFHESDCFLYVVDADDVDAGSVAARSDGKAPCESLGGFRTEQLTQEAFARSADHDREP